jgi:hypothetical protein
MAKKALSLIGGRSEWREPESPRTLGRFAGHSSSCRKVLH